ncbi:MAG: hypothetical protein HYS18_05915 [Burkholderiales bacterium]|nr:hypothetical protein [Burkholderiales bacterium]
MSIRKQKGVALPVALILFVVMLIGALYLAKSAGSSAGSASNLAYQRSISRAADVALLNANNWLGTQALTKAALYDHQSAQGYRATFAFVTPALTPADPTFWTGSTTMTAYNDVDGTPIRVEYIIYRLCNNTGEAALPNLCIKSPGSQATNTSDSVNGMRAGDSWDAKEPPQNRPPVTHYLVTARVINAARGTTVINQLVVTMGV